MTWRKDHNLIFESVNLHHVNIKDSSENYQCVVEVTNPLTRVQKELQQRNVLLSLFVVPYSDIPESMSIITAVHEYSQIGN